MRLNCKARLARILSLLSVFMMSTGMPPAALAADAPPGRFIVTFAAGGSTDNVARALAAAMQEVTGRQYIVENKPGASGTIATQEVARSKPDGSVLLFTTAGITTNAALFKKLPYDTLKDLTPISKLSEAKGFLLIVPNSSPYKTLDELLTAARQQPGRLSYGSAGIGNTTHLAGALFERAANIKLLHVPYKSSAVTDLMAGQIDMLFWGSNFASQLVQTGKVRALALAGPNRIEDLPDVPTLEEKGIKGMTVPAWSGVFAPAGLPPDDLKRLSADVAKAMGRPVFIEAVKASGGTVASTTQTVFAAEVRAEVERFRRELPALGISME